MTTTTTPVVTFKTVTVHVPDGDPDEYQSANWVTSGDGVLVIEQWIGPQVTYASDEWEYVVGEKLDGTVRARNNGGQEATL